MDTLFQNYSFTETNFLNVLKRNGAKIAQSQYRFVNWVLYMLCNVLFNVIGITNVKQPRTIILMGHIQNKIL